MTTADLTILSLGAGVQSSTMALMAARREINPMPDAAIFADTGWEPKGVYDWLDWLETKLPFPVHRVAAGNLRDDQLASVNTTGQRFAAVPYFLSNGGMGRRQCTKEYKIEPVTRHIRQMLGLQKGERAVGKYFVEEWLGISWDEMARMKDSRHKWIRHRFPLIELEMTRGACLKWMEERQYPKPAKSACIGCPYHSDAEWRSMKEEDPASFADAVAFDRALREGEKGGMKHATFVHRSRRPLDQVDFTNLEDHGQINWLDECDGMCGL